MPHHMTTEPVQDQAVEPTSPALEPPPIRRKSRIHLGLGPYRRAAIVGGILVAGVLLYFVVGAFVAYTDDAYMQSDLVPIAPEVAGFVKTVAVEYNEKVSTGDLIATIDPEPYQLDVALKQQQVASLEAAVEVKAQSQAAADANVDAAKAAVTLAQREYQRIKILTGEQYVSQADLDKASDALANAQDAQAAREAEAQVNVREVAAAKAQVAVAEADLAVSQYNLSRTRLTAPVDGYINNLTIRPGAYVRAGDAIIGIVDNSRWRIIANFKEEVAAPVAPGTRVWVWLDSHPGSLLPGRVQGTGRGIARTQTEEGLLPYVAPTTDWIRLRRRLPVTILLDPPVPQDALFSGADARVLFFR
jgi:multidrug efflux system membrane fusion protein